MTYDIKTRKDAVKDGDYSYFTGEPCKYNHISPRRTDSGSCLECRKVIRARWSEKGKVKSDEELKGKPLPLLNLLYKLFEVDFEKGILWWKYRPPISKSNKIFNTRYAGKIAGHRHYANKYVTVRIEGKLYQLHRIIYKMYYLEDPTGVIDHIDNDPCNNSITNLKNLTSAENTILSVKTRMSNKKRIEVLND